MYYQLAFNLLSSNYCICTTQMKTEWTAIGIAKTATCEVTWPEKLFQASNPPVVTSNLQRVGKGEALLDCAPSPLTASWNTKALNHLRQQKIVPEMYLQCIFLYVTVFWINIFKFLKSWDRGEGNVSQL